MSRMNSRSGSIAPTGLIIVGSAIATLVVAFAALTFWNVFSGPTDRIRPGISIAKVDLGGRSTVEMQTLVNSRLTQYASSPIALTFPGGARQFTATELGFIPDISSTVNAIKSQGTELRREQLMGDLSGATKPQAIEHVFTIDEPRLMAVIDRMSSALDRVPTDADARINPDTSVELIPARIGQRVIREEMARRVGAAFQSMDQEIAVPLDAIQPTISDDDTRAARTSAEQLLALPLEVRAGDLSWTLGRGDLASWIVFSRVASSPPRLVFGLHSERPKNWLIDRVNEVSRPARDSRFRLVKGKLTVVTPEETGQSLDRAAALSAIQTAIARVERKVELPVKVVPPRIGAADLAKLSFPDLLADSSTAYAGSIPERAHNVELATARVDGVVIPAGATFSFNQAIGRTRLRDGYRVAYGIVSDPNGAQTVPSVAGGICQVSTTLFHSVFWSGLPVDERHPHPYWIPRYGSPPRGVTGLDTTVDEDSDLDFQFRNTTAAPILIQATTDGAKVNFALIGTKPGWDIVAANPVITNVVKPDTAQVRQDDPTLAMGRTIQVEEARDGFDALVSRTVSKGGAVIDRLNVKSHYEPSRNVTLVGTRRGA